MIDENSFEVKGGLLHFTIQGEPCSWDPKNHYNSTDKVLEKFEGHWVKPSGRPYKYHDHSVEALRTIKKLTPAVANLNKFLKDCHDKELTALSTFRKRTWRHGKAKEASSLKPPPKQLTQAPSSPPASSKSLKPPPKQLTQAPSSPPASSKSLSSSSSSSLKPPPKQLTQALSSPPASSKSLSSSSSASLKLESSSLKPPPKQPPSPKQMEVVSSIPVASMPVASMPVASMPEASSVSFAVDQPLRDEFSKQCDRNQELFNNARDRDLAIIGQLRHQNLKIDTNTQKIGVLEDRTSKIESEQNKSAVKARKERKKRRGLVSVVKNLATALGRNDVVESVSVGGSNSGSSNSGSFLSALSRRRSRGTVNGGSVNDTTCSVNEANPNSGEDAIEAVIVAKASPVSDTSAITSNASPKVATSNSSPTVSGEESPGDESPPKFMWGFGWYVRMTS